MAWQSLTHQFGGREISAIEVMSAERLIPPILNSPPIVALRVLAELHLHEANDRLRALLSNQEISAHWRKYHLSLSVDERDQGYARSLEAFK